MIKDPCWANANHTAIDCVVTVNGDDMPFTAMANDLEALGRSLWRELIVGQHGVIADYVAPPPAQPIPKSNGTNNL